MSLDLQQTTKQWIDSIIDYYDKHDSQALNQVYAKGYFAGMSAREIYNLALHLKDNAEKHPIKMIL